MGSRFQVPGSRFPGRGLILSAGRPPALTGLSPAPTFAVIVFWAHDRLGTWETWHLAPGTWHIDITPND